MTPRQKAKKAAFDAGFKGRWPSEKAKLNVCNFKDETDVIRAMDYVEAGFHESAMARAFERHAFTWFRRLNAQHYRQMARCGVMLLHEKNDIRTRIRGMKALMSPMVKAVKLLHRLDSLGEQAIAAKLARNFKAYVEELQRHDKVLSNAAVNLMDVMANNDNEQIRLVAFESVMDITLQTMELLAVINKRSKKKLTSEYKKQINKNNKAVKAAYKQVDDMEAEFEARAS